MDHVKKNLFTTIKFVNDNLQLKFGDDIARKVIRDMHVWEGNEENWWRLYKPAVSWGITDRRNVASVVVKLALEGKDKSCWVAHWGNHRALSLTNFEMPTASAIMLIAVAKKDYKEGDMKDEIMPEKDDIMKL